MDEFDHRRGLYPLAISAARANFGFLVLAMAIQTAYFLIDLYFERHPEADTIHVMAAYTASIVPWLLAEMILAFTILPTLLSNGADRGATAFRWCSAKKVALYIGYVFLTMFVIGLVIGLFGIVSFLSGPDGFSEEADAGTNWIYQFLVMSWLVLWVLALVFSGLVMPDIVAQGRLSLGTAIRQGYQNFWRLFWLISAAAVPMSLLSGYLLGDFDQGYLEEDDPGFGQPINLEDVLINGAASAATVAASVLISVAVFKVYRVVAPAEEQIHDQRVAEVFD